MRGMLIPALLMVVPAFAGDGLDGFLKNLNIQARADMNGFTAKVAAEFGTEDFRVKAVLSNVQDPADAFMVFQLGKMTNQPPDRVLATYKAHKGKGWGAIAKELGIKPGSAEFHALKRGDFRFGHQGRDEDGDDRKHGHDKGKGKGKKH